MFGHIGSVKTFSKGPGSWHECRPIYGLHFLYIGFYPLYKKGFFWGVSGSVWPFWPSKWLVFFKL